jgi:hypothetical protein
MNICPRTHFFFLLFPPPPPPLSARSIEDAPWVKRRSFSLFCLPLSLLFSLSALTSCHELRSRLGSHLSGSRAGRWSGGSSAIRDGSLPRLRLCLLFWAVVVVVIGAAATGTVGRSTGCDARRGATGVVSRVVIEGIDGSESRDGTRSRNERCDSAAARFASMSAYSGVSYKRRRKTISQFLFIQDEVFLAHRIASCSQVYIQLFSSLEVF